MSTGTVLQFPISLGIDEGTNPKTQPPGTLKTGMNVRFDKLGRTAKRHGTTHLSNTTLSGGTIQGADRLFTRGDELCIVRATGTGATLHAYSSAQQKWGGVPIHDVGLTWSTLIDSTNGARSVDIAISGSLLLYSWVTGDPSINDSSGYNWGCIVDQSGTIILPPTLLNATAVQVCRVVVMGGYAFVFSSDNAGGIYYTSINLATFAVSASNVLRNDANLPAFDACLADATRIAVVYENSSNLTKIYRYTQAAGVLSSTGNATSAELGTEINAIACASDGTTVFLCYHTDSNSRVRYCGFNLSSLTETTAPASLDTSAVIASAVSVVVRGAASLIFGWTVDGDATGTGIPRTSTIPWTSGGGLQTNALRTSSSIQLASRIFAFSNRYFAIALDHSDGRAAGANTYLSSYLLEIETSSTLSTFVPHRMLGKIDDGISGMPAASNTSGGGSMLPSAALDSEGRMVVPVFFQATAPAKYYFWRCGVRLVRVSTSSGRTPDMWRSISIGQELYYAAGLLGAWDGRITFDYGMRPATLRVVTASANSGSVANGTYIYQVAPTFRSFAGITHRGAPSKQLAATVANLNAKVTAFVSPHSIDSKESTSTGFGNGSAGRVLLEVYRSVVNASTPQKLTLEPLINVLYNDPTATSLSFVDTRSDASIAGTALSGFALSSRPTLYTEGGELPDAQPPAPYGLCLHIGRIFILTGGRREVWWSKDIDENPGLAPGFDATQRFVFEEDMTALLGLEDKLVFYSRRGIQYTFGDGPTVSGADNRFAPPRVMPSDVGCTNPRSLVMTPLGHFFQSDRGIYLLSRTMELAWIGEGIRDTLAAFPTITSAVLVSSENEVRFTANNAGGTEGRVLVYDYLRKQWLVRAYASFALANTPIADACVWQGLWTFATPTGDVYQETTTHSLDGGSTFVQQTVGLAAIAAGGTSSWSRVRRVQIAGQSTSNHQLSISIKRDFSDAVMQTKTFDAGSDATQIGPLEKAQIDLKYQKTQAVEITVSDAAPANVVTHPVGTGAGFVLEGVALLIQPKSGLAKISNGRRG